MELQNPNAQATLSEDEITVETLKTPEGISKPKGWQGAADGSDTEADQQN
jgi:hypothetical protein